MSSRQTVLKRSMIGGQQLKIRLVLFVVGCTIFFLFGCSSLSAKLIPSEVNAQPGSTASVYENVDDELASQFEAVPETTWKMVVAASEMAMKKHVDPPTRQQMMLYAIRGMYFAHRKNSPRGLSEGISSCTTGEQFKAALDKHWRLSAGDKATVGQVQQTMLNGLAKSFDPNAFFVTPKALRVEKQLSENRYVGIGIRLAFEDGYSVITDPIVGGTARKAGSKPGDVILEIDGESTKGKSIGQVVDELRGELGTKVSVKVRNKKSGETRLMNMIRAKIPIPTVQAVQYHDDDSWDYALTEDRKLGYLRFDRIVGSTAAEAKTMAAEMDDQGFEQVVLDFRVGSTVDFHHALMLADSLVGEQDLGKIHEGEMVRQLKTRSDHCLAGKKIYVIAKQNVTGAELLVYIALKKAGAIFVGQPLIASGKVGERVDLGDGLGAISNVSTSFFSPGSVPQPKHSNSSAEMETGSGMFSYQPDHFVPRVDAAKKCIQLYEASKK